MTASTVLEVALDFLLLSTPILGVALVLVAVHRPSSRRDLILKVALLAAVTLPLLRAAAQGSAVLAESSPALLAVTGQRPALALASTDPGSLSPIDVLLVIW
ncbi:MAG TPA: hypothetical protein VMM79_18315, partial [Longimicrobiales bacterium]|nr:hypothetical protein [Longimicrobiales bacterium]